jgi:thiamine-phosphate pyrophosphorylase
MIDLDKFKLQYISQGENNIEQLAGIKNVLEGGCKWIQLRMKRQLTKEFALEVKEYCKEYNATFIINDYVELAKKVNADGVHIGKSDMDIIKARKILGNKIIGGTANTFDDIIKLIDTADYIGLGPYR